MRKRKLQKNSKRIKENTIMASFLAKIGWKKHRKSEDKNYRTVPLQTNS